MTAREQLTRAPADALRTVAGLATLDEAGARTARALAVAALSRGLPDRVLSGPEVEVLQVRPASAAAVVFAQDARGGVWRWSTGGDAGEAIARLPTIASDLLVAPSGRAWVAVAADTLVGGRQQDGAWHTWQAPAGRGGQYLIASDERWVVSHGYTRGVAAWDLSTGAEVPGAFPQQLAWVQDLRSRVTPDARFLAQAAYKADKVTIWDRVDGRVREVDALGEFGDFYGVSAEGRTLIGGSRSGETTRLIAWDLERGAASVWRDDAASSRPLGPLFAVDLPSTDGLTFCAAQPPAGCGWQRPLGDARDRVLASGDARHFAVDTYEHEQHRRPIELGELATGKTTRRFHASADSGEGVLDQAGHYLAARGRVIDVWAPRDPAHAIVDVRRGGPDVVDTPSPDAIYMIRYRKSDRSLVRIDRRSGAEVALESCITADGSPRFEVDDRGRALVSQGSQVNYYAADATRPRRMDVPEPIARTVLSPDGRGLAAVAVDRTAYVWADPERPPHSFEIGADGLPILMFDATGARVATSSYSRGVQVVTGATSVQVLPPGPDKSIVLAEPSSDARTLAAVQVRTGAVVLHDFETATTRSLPVTLAMRDTGYFGLAVADDGSQVAVSDAERLFLIDAASGAMRQLDAGGNVWGMVFDPAGGLLFGAVGDAVQAWDLSDLSVTPMWATNGPGRLLRLSPTGALTTRENGEVRRFALELVPREPAPLQAWLRERSAALNPAG